MKQQTIIIIGATSGIGKTLFEKYAADGNRIGIVGRRTHLLDELRQEHPDMTVTATADKGHGDRYIGSLFRVDEPVPDDSHDVRMHFVAQQRILSSSPNACIGAN